MNRALRRGRVVDADGRAVASALVSVVWGTAPTPEIGRRTGDDGGFHVGLPQGRFLVRAISAAGAVGEIEVDGGDGDGDGDGDGGEILIQLSTPPAKTGG